MKYLSRGVDAFRDELDKEDEADDDEDDDCNDDERDEVTGECEKKDDWETLVGHEAHNMESYDSVKKKKIYQELDVYKNYVARRKHEEGFDYRPDDPDEEGDGDAASVSNTQFHDDVDGKPFHDDAVLLLIEIDEQLEGLEAER